MKVGTFVVSLGAVALISYVAGRFELPFDGSNVAVAQQGDHPEHPKKSDHPEHPGASPEMEKQMEAWAKVGTPGEHHKVLDQMAGTWDAEYSFTFDPSAEMMTSVGTVKREWILGNRYLQEKVNATGMGPEPFEGLGYVGYNNQDNVYEVIWMDNMSTAIMKETGTYDAANKKMKFKGTFKDPVTGKVVATRSEVDLSNPKRHVMVGWMKGPDGKEFEHMKGVSEKK